MKNKEIIWSMRDGIPIMLGEMEDSHLLNTIMYLTRRQREYDDTFRAVVKSGTIIPELVINGETVKIWLERFQKELMRRSKKEAERVQKYIEKTQINPTYPHTVGEDHG